MGGVTERVQRLDNPVQRYAWGSRTAIAELCGRPPSPHPEAELWMGAHPKAPSRIFSNGRSMTLEEWIKRDPEAILGQSVARCFGPRLPFLFKVLAAAEPLSIQAHPNQLQARNGFERENRAGIPLDAPLRNYRDDNHKPEIICALTPFWGLNGFRPLEELLRQLQRFCPRSLAALVAGHSASPGQTLQCLLDRMLTMDAVDRTQAIAEALEHAGDLPSGDPMARWLRKLHAAYPGDIGILTPIILNLVRLKPGQAMYLPAGQLHAYLEGVGIELMANSDNVLRGGLTPKHIDRGELMRVLRFAPSDPGVMTPDPLSPTEACFPTPAHEFRLSKLSVTPSRPHQAPGERNVEILLVTQGDLTIESAGDAPMGLARGESILIPAAAGGYLLSGRGEAFKATVP